MQKEGLARSLMEKAGELGLLSADISEEYDGAGTGKVTSALIAENIVAGGPFSVTLRHQSDVKKAKEQSWRPGGSPE